MFNKFIFIFIFYLTIIILTAISIPTINFGKLEENNIKMTSTDMPHQPAVPPTLEKDIIHPTQSLFEIAKKSSTSRPQNIQTQLLSFT
uniref:Secreted protein n=1 Tax=Strongyloides venezuelensis TaxID=75913 RepID=A0A0K0FYF4_STRVS